MRGKYKHNDYEYIVTQLKGMTREEQQRLLHEPFESLWEKLWGPPAAGTNPYRHEKEMSRAKLEALRTGTPSLEMLLNRIHEHLPWDTPEWGFPKGRRDPHETEFSCALREMWEETGLSEKDVVPIKNLEPLTEIFTGSNHVNYCHKYYVLYEPSGRPIQYDPTNELMKREVGDIRWCTLEEGLALIRPENSEKREILAQAHRLLRKYCPFHLADLGNSQK
jgi:8-oxo-dGTP pyrophosphatase MutT (NUDIX family)